MAPVPNYYHVLSLNNYPNLINEDIVAAYKVAALLTHPDRNPDASESERREAQEGFQKVADAFFILSDPARRRDYDRLLRHQLGSDFNDQYKSSAQNTLRFDDPFQILQSLFFTPQDSPSSPSSAASSHFRAPKTNKKPDPHATFAQVCKSAFSGSLLATVLLEDLLRPEIKKENETSGAWKYLGLASGGALGLIVGNVTGMAIGALVGKRLGAVRDISGKSFCEVFNQLTAAEKAKVVGAIGSEVLSYTNGKTK